MILKTQKEALLLLGKVNRLFLSSMMTEIPKEHNLLWHTILVQSLVWYTSIEVYRSQTQKVPCPALWRCGHGTFCFLDPAERTVTNPDIQLPCHLLNTLLRTVCGREDPPLYHQLRPEGRSRERPDHGAGASPICKSPVTGARV